MSFRTEMGLYYSYFKTIVESETFLDGMYKIRHDNLSEYPNIINAESKYSLEPEVTLGGLYHIAKYFNLLPKPVCWQIERGDDLSTITSCEGFGVPVYFYLEGVWFFSFFTGFVMFMYAYKLSDSIGGGIISVSLFFFNHTECTRVQWTPPLRESFAYPTLLYQMYLLTFILKKEKKRDLTTQVDFIILIGFCMMSWQFSQFVFITQTIAMLILKWLRIIERDMYLFYCKVHSISVTLAFIATGNMFLLNSLHLTLLSISLCAIILSQLLSFIFDPKTTTLLEIILILVCTKIWKMSFTYSSDDEHIFNLLKAKISGYKDFHTMLYTCAPEFDFLKYETYEAIVGTFLLPTAILAGFLILYYWYRNLKSQGYPNCIEPHVAYNVLQTGAFVIMAIFIMRLKLLMTPNLCLMAGLACSPRYLAKLGIKKWMTQCTLIAVLLSIMSYHGMQRLQKERGFIGEYSNVHQEELLEWIKVKTPKNAVFAGKMSLMANVMLSTQRPIVNNPYYESKEMRDRTMKVYEIYSRKPVSEIHDTLRKLQVDYVVIENCNEYGIWKPGCKMSELWDLVDEGKMKSKGMAPACSLLFYGAGIHPFRRVFQNHSYVVLQLNYTKYVEYKPKNILYSAR
ncbi:probable C-mannosyltransferase DPY19L1 isoform X2 [Phymastichus coffea]|nr:probable C-mannosyltransferase DPY19L1 isoform X2 [Phymastichus coffea]